jgi:uncharacterized protein YjbJ (UPF0337 family)
MIINQDRFATEWSKLRGQIKEQWGKLTDDDLLAIAGQREQLLASIREKYGIAVEEAERQVAEWEAKIAPGPSEPK